MNVSRAFLDIPNWTPIGFLSPKTSKNRIGMHGFAKFQYQALFWGQKIKKNDFLIIPPPLFLYHIFVRVLKWMAIDLQDPAYPEPNECVQGHHRYPKIHPYWFAKLSDFKKYDWHAWLCGISIPSPILRPKNEKKNDFSIPPPSGKF